MSETTARDRLILEVVRTHAEGAVQVSLSQVDENGVGFGYRLAGSKHYNQGVTPMLEEELTERDASNIRAMLDAAFPVAATPDAEEPAPVDTQTLPVSDRDVLADKLAECGYEGMSARETADALLEAGARPPARRIETVEELGSLPVGAVVRYGNWIEQQREPGEWEAPGIEGVSHTATVFADAAAEGAEITVVHIPTEAAS